MATLTVGADKQFRTISAAVSAAQANDTVAIDAGTYTNDFPGYINKPLTLQGVGGLAHITGTATPSNGKGALIPMRDLTVDHMEFSSLGEGSRGNISGIRHEGGNLVIRNSYFHDNQSGLLSTPQPGNPPGTVRIEDSEFARNGDGSGQTHNIYVNEQASLFVRNLYSHDSNAGHNLKSRAEVSEVYDSRFTSEANDAGVEAYSLDFPNGGAVTVRNSWIQQSADADQRGMVSFGAEPNRGIWANSRATLDGNTAVDDSASPASFFANWPGSPATISNTKVWGLSDEEMVTRVETTTAVTGTTRLASRPADDESSPIGGAVEPPPPGEEPPPPPPPDEEPPPPVSEPGRTVTGGGNNDSLTGGSGNDTVLGISGADTLLGQAGDDRLEGGSGNDVLVGGAGDDLLIGGSGNDRFVFGPGAGHDTATGFASPTKWEQDILDLRGHGLAAGDVVIAQAGADAMVSVAAWDWSVALEGKSASNIAVGADILL